MTKFTDAVISLFKSSKNTPTTTNPFSDNQITSNNEQDKQEEVFHNIDDQIAEETTKDEIKYISLKKVPVDVLNSDIQTEIVLLKSKKNAEFDFMFQKMQNTIDAFNENQDFKNIIIDLINKSPNHVSSINTIKEDLEKGEKLNILIQKMLKNNFLSHELNLIFSKIKYNKEEVQDLNEKISKCTNEIIENDVNIKEILELIKKNTQNSDNENKILRLEEDNQDDLNRIEKLTEKIKDLTKKTKNLTKKTKNLQKFFKSYNEIKFFQDLPLDISKYNIDIELAYNDYNCKYSVTDRFVLEFIEENNKTKLFTDTFKEILIIERIDYIENMKMMQKPEDFDLEAKPKIPAQKKGNTDDILDLGDDVSDIYNQNSSDYSDPNPQSSKQGMQNIMHHKFDTLFTPNDSKTTQEVIANQENIIFWQKDKQNFVYFSSREDKILNGKSIRQELNKFINKNLFEDSVGLDFNSLMPQTSHLEKKNALKLNPKTHDEQEILIEVPYKPITVKFNNVEFTTHIKVNLVDQSTNMVFYNENNDDYLKWMSIELTLGEHNNTNTKMQLNGFMNSFLFESNYLFKNYQEHKVEKNLNEFTMQILSQNTKTFANKSYEEINKSNYIAYEDNIFDTYDIYNTFTEDSFNKPIHLVTTIGENIDQDSLSKGMIFE